jgi:enoyl-CoA hydratase/carnithine racemase
MAADKAGPTIRLTEDGLPAGFLSPLEALTTIKFAIEEEGIGVIRLNRPDKLNAFDELMIREVRSVIWRSNFDERIGVVVITGEGRAFCSGRDIFGLDYENNLPTAQYRAYVRANHEMFDDMEALEKPLIAAVNGIAAGGGVEMAIACDFRICIPEARFVLTENQLGVLPASGACSRMIQMIGIGRLKEMVLMARPVDGEEAYRIGLVNRVVAKERLWEETMAFARQLLQKSPLAMGMAKHIINTCQNVDTETGRILERLGQSVLIRTEDSREGNAAFREKRPPQFKGR